MQSYEIRQKYLDFFKGKGHTVVPGIPLIPPEDPTLLFTSAGMVPFKNFWAGSGEIPYLRAASCQKCLRAGGKDSDLDNVGFDFRHNTFLEMLGNFSFGDYFKEEAVEFAWEFLMQHLRLPEANLWASVYTEDQDAVEIWKKYLPEKRIVRLGAKDNFWGPAGETGVCGPCSEIYFDRGPAFSCGEVSCAPGCDCERYLEFWNLVFPQFDKNKNGEFLPLKRRGIDTGMGLERITTLCQEAESNFDTDLFQPIIKRLETLSGILYRKDKNTRIAFRAVVDHVRALTFTIAENIIPGNEGRGYVIRRILRRAVQFLDKMKVNQPLLAELVPEVIRIMGPYYPYLSEREGFIRETIAGEEDRFRNLLSESRTLFQGFVTEFKDKTLPGKIAFQLYDTHGLPLDTIKEIAAEKNLFFDEAGFEAEMTRQKAAGRKATSFELIADRSHLTGLSPTRFIGYETGDARALVLAIIPVRNNQYSLVLSETPFYPERGGQQGDVGKISGDGFEFSVQETRVDESGFIHHLGVFHKGIAINNSPVTAKVDIETQQQIAANHTSTHLLHSALLQILGSEVKQAGSLVTPEYLRFDFLFSGEIDAEKLGRVEELINKTVRSNLRVTTAEKEIKEALAENAIALFTEKYGAKVRVVTAGDFSKEVCGGIHLKSTGSIGLCLITSFSSIGQGVKRIEAITGKYAYDSVVKRKKYIAELAEYLKVEPDSIHSEMIRSTEEYRKLETKSNVFFSAYIHQEADKMIKGKKSVAGINLLTTAQSLLSPEEARKLIDYLKKKSSESALLILLSGTEKTQIFLGLTPDLISRGLKANEILRQAAGLLGGGAGGRDDFAQAGLKKRAHLEEVEKILIKILTDTIGKSGA
ncbi:MAG: alanine--tRNA ligase [Candidatus Omnitrophica bacterium]|nr:alanine--tRNA ligase [Candidatus Omnitrophota bacterium]